MSKSVDSPTQVAGARSKSAEESVTSPESAAPADFRTSPGASSIGTKRIWVMAARPRTLPAAVAPVLVGTALAAHESIFRPLGFLAALLGALLIQIGTNFANDYSEAKRGADTEDRLGPRRVTASGLIPPSQVLTATWIVFAGAFLVGTYLAVTAGWQLILVGVASILAGFLYTGGPRPYGYTGLGEIFVFLFFGVVAVAGSYFVQAHHLEWQAFGLALPVGLLASAILMVNNVRDIDTDRRAGKRTLAVLLGSGRSRSVYTMTVAGAFVSVLILAPALPAMWILAALITAPLALKLTTTVVTTNDDPALNIALAQTGMLLLLFCSLLALGLLAS